MWTKKIQNIFVSTICTSPIIGHVRNSHSFYFTDVRNKYVVKGLVFSVHYVEDIVWTNFKFVSN